MSGATGVRGTGSVKGATKGDIRVSDADKSGTTDLGITEIEGRIYKPSVFYVLGRGTISYKGIDFTTNFVPRIFKDATKLPF